MSFSLTVMSPEGFSCFTVGETSPYKMPAEGAALHISPQGLTVVLSMSGPTALEIDAIRGKVPGRAGVVVTGRLGFLVFDLGNGVKFECPFDAGVENPDNVPVLERLTPESRLGLLIVASDPTDHRIFALRFCTLSPTATQLISQTFRKQMAEPVTRQQNIADVQSAYKRYPSVLDMIRAAAVFDTIGR